MSPVLDHKHDYAHPVESDGAWSESYYFNCYDPSTDCGFFTRIGVRPNDGTIDVGLSVWKPGGGLARIGHVRPQTEMIDQDLEVGPVRYRMLEPGRRWLLSADGSAESVAMEVTFEALTPLIGADGQDSAGEGASAQTRSIVGKGHLEQAGRWSGWIEIDGARVELGPDTMGNRDKSWGPRRWGGPRMWRWFSINVDEGTHFGGIRIGTDAGDLHRGWVWRDGALASIERWDVSSELEDDGVTHAVTRLLVTDKSGRTHQLEGRMLRVEPGPAGLRPNTTIVNEGLATWTYEGRQGYGISEYLHQLDDQAQPVVGIE